MARDITAEDWPAKLTDAQLISLVGGKSFMRATSLADAAHVTGIAVAGGGAIITATVRGSGAQSYHVCATQSHPKSWSLTCTCPVGTWCKHGAAMLMVARERALNPHPGWRQRVEQLLTPAPAPHQALGLHVTLIPAGTHSAADVGLFPLLEGARGWRARGTSWSHLLGGGLDGQVPEAVLDPLKAMARLSTAPLYYTHDLLRLGAIGPRAWDLLGQAVDAGAIMMTSPRDGAAVRLGPPLRPGLAIRTTTDGNLALLPAVSTDVDSPLPLTAPATVVSTDSLDCFPVGSPAFALAERAADSSVTLHQLTPAVTGGLRQVFEHGAADTLIPAEHVTEFEEEILPGLVRSLPVLEVPAQLAVPEAVTIRPVLRVTVTSVHDVTTAWLMRYVDDAGRVRREEVTGNLPVEATPPPHSTEPGPAPGDREQGTEAGRPVLRDRHGEAQAGSRAATRLFPLTGEHGRLWHPLHLTGTAAARFAVRTLPLLEGMEELDVEVHGAVSSFRKAEGELQVSTDISDDPDGRPDWFSLRVRVRVGEHEVPLERLMAAVAHEETEVMLDSGTWVDLSDRSEVLALVELMEQGRDLCEPGAAGEGRMRLSVMQAGYYSQLEALGVIGEVTERWRQSVARLLEARQGAEPHPTGGGLISSSLTVPDGLTATLRDYQLGGFQWLTTLRRLNLGGILADDMGLGKTIQILASVLQGKADGAAHPVLVLAPTSVLGSWAEQAQRFAPGLRVRTLRQTAATRGYIVAEVARSADLVITSYAIVRLDEDDMAAQPWSWVILDEAQAVKNRNSALYKAVRRLRSPSTIAVTGTPLENSLMDLWSLMSVSAPGLLPGPEAFTRLYRKPINRGGEQGARALADLHRRIQPFMLRRRKHDVALDLPPKTEQVLTVRLTPAHQRAYDARLSRERQKVMGLLEDDTTQARFSALRSLTILRQLALDPHLIDAPDGPPSHTPDAPEQVQTPEQAGPSRGSARRQPASAKTELLGHTLTALAAQGHQALVFSQFTRYLSRVRSHLEGIGLRVAYMDGSTTDRAGVIAEFRNGSADVFLISLRAGGFGLTLTEADYVFLLDPWWNPQVEEQAVDRTHRIGQDNPVMVYRLVAAGTIEDKVMALKEKKAALFSRVIDATGTPDEAQAHQPDSPGATDAISALNALSADDIRSLLELPDATGSHADGASRTSTPSSARTRVRHDPTSSAP